MKRLQRQKCNKLEKYEYNRSKKENWIETMAREILDTHRREAAANAEIIRFDANTISWK